jgi:hypothetical protein
VLMRGVRVHACMLSSTVGAECTCTAQQCTWICYAPHAEPANAAAHTRSASERLGVRAGGAGSGRGSGGDHGGITRFSRDALLRIRSRSHPLMSASTRCASAYSRLRASSLACGRQRHSDGTAACSR